MMMMRGIAFKKDLKMPSPERQHNKNILRLETNDK